MFDKICKELLTGATGQTICNILKKSFLESVKDIELLLTKANYGFINRYLLSEIYLIKIIIILIMLISAYIVITYYKSTNYKNNKM